MTAATWVLHVAADLDEVNRHWAALVEAGMLGAAEIDGHTAVYFAQRATDLGLAGEWERIAHQDWHARWRAGLAPVVAGRWTVTPTWHATGAAHELVIDPGQAFGTGHHETTVSCLRALDELPLPGRRLLDLGTGSGILAIAAARRGARVVAVDTDPLAVDAAHANAQRNGVALDLRLGDNGTVAGERFDVVVANLDTPTLTRLADELAGLLARDGTLILSGVGNDNAAAVAGALRDAGLDVTTTTGVEWALVRARPVTA
ncbi:MAG TPA: 50S ribosomal protein L11 methyltransferase [Euzebyales bacterium]|nr:50S ribosomal protein L11 methyltransferase [Euzebyales bacterium]